MPNTVFPVGMWYSVSYLPSGVNGDRSGSAYLCGEEFFATPKTEAEVNAYVEEKL